MSCIDSATIYVKDLTKSAQFYNAALGLAVVEDTANAKSLVLNGDCKISLMQANPVSDDGLYDLGEGISGIGISRPSPVDVLDMAELNGGKIILPADEYAYAASMVPDEDEMKSFPVKYGTVQDPDNYSIEVKESSSSEAAKIVMNVEDLNDSIDFYTNTIGMALLRKRSNVYNVPKSASMVGYVGFGSETEGVFIELLYNYATEKINLGAEQGKLHIKVDDLSAVIDRLTASNMKYSLLDEDGKNSVLTADPTGFQVQISQN